MARLFYFTLHQSLRAQGSLNGVLHGMQWIIVYGLPSFVSSAPHGGGLNTKLGDHDTSKSHNPRFMRTYCVGPT